LLSSVVRAQSDPAYVPPKAGYDTPDTFAYKFDAVGETCECSLGTPISNAYRRQVRLKAQGSRTCAD
jgi:hypothetical protein